MSFSSDTKKELCKAVNKNNCCNLALCYGMLLFAKKFSFQEIVASTENPYVASLFCDMLSSEFFVTTEKKAGLTVRKQGSRLYTISLPYKEDCRKIFSAYGHGVNDVCLRINRANFDDDLCVAAFLRGAFLTCGTVTDPKGDYHLEFTVPYKNLSADLEKLISEVEQLNCTFKTVQRKGYFVVYVKGSEAISDVLTYIGAPVSAMNVMQEKMIKELRNKINRTTNSEVANIKKTADAAARQIAAIEKIKRSKGLNSLSDDLKTLSEIRLENPELSLRDIGKLLNPPISRSGVNHRITRILEIAADIKD